MTGRTDAAPARWWEGAVIYQIYPRSFADSNGDGIGDLIGIAEHLDHLRGTDASLGVDAIWISPFYPSPLHDFGYDISDFTEVAPEFGTLQDFDRLVDAAHARGLRVILDLVPCHTSVEHPWFREHRDWYIWADPAPAGGPPNNWLSAFGGSAWELEPESGQYYLHSFYPEQPDLDWRNPAVADAIHEAMRFWFRRGVDGFRADAIAHAIKDDMLRDNPPQRHPTWMPTFGSRGTQEPLWNVDRPEVHDVIRGLRRVAEECGGRLLIGEVYTTLERLAGYLGHGADDEFQLAWNFELLHTAWDAGAFALAIERAEALHPPGVWPSIAFSNHDNPRHATRWGRERARLAALLLLTLRGVPTLYMGEEIGMVDHPALPDGIRFDRAGRDAQRTPMQWSADTGAGAGFTAGEPWLPAVDPQVANVASQRDDAGSLLALYRHLIRLRRNVPALGTGSQRSLFGCGPDIVAWLREADGQRVLVLANMADAPRRAEQRRAAGPGTVLAGTLGRSGAIPDVRSVELQPLEGLVIGLGEGAWPASG